MKPKFKLKFLLSAAAVVCAAVFGLVFYGAYHENAAVDVSRDFVKIIDVGQADCILIYSGGCSALIDTGLASSADEVAEALDSAGIKTVDVLMLTHMHDDHAGGFELISEQYGIDNLILPDYEFAKGSYTSDSDRVYTEKQGMNFEIGGFEITLLAEYGDLPEENDRSVFVMAENSGKKFLFTGDAGKRAEERLLEERINIDCDVLKAGHHGSDSSLAKEFLAAASPEYAAISVGENNSYSHPSPETLSALGNCGAEILRTDKNGDITFYVENGEIKAETEK